MEEKYWAIVKERGKEPFLKKPINNGMYGVVMLVRELRGFYPDAEIMGCSLCGDNLWADSAEHIMAMDDASQEELMKLKPEYCIRFGHECTTIACSMVRGSWVSCPSRLPNVKEELIRLRRLYGASRRWEQTRHTGCHKCHTDADGEFYKFMRQYVDEEDALKREREAKGI